MLLTLALIVLTMRSANLIVHYELFTMGLVLIMKLIVGRVQLWAAYCGRARMSTGADCRTSSAQVDRQGWASGERGRGRSTVWRGGTWASRQARAWEMGRAMRREDMLGKCCLGVRNVSWLLAGLGKEVASAERAGPEGS